MRRSIPLYPAVYALRRRFHEEGTRGAARHVLARTRAQLAERNRHFVVVKDLREIIEPRWHEGLVLEPIERHHLPALSTLNHERHDLTGDQRFVGDLDAGYSGFVGHKDGELIAFYWWTDAERPPHRELSSVALGIRLGSGDVYGTDFYVAERHRGSGAASDFLYQLERALRERGFERLWQTVEEDNQPARRTYAARGYREQWTVVGRRRLRRWNYRTEALEPELPRS